MMKIIGVERGAYLSVAILQIQQVAFFHFNICLFQSHLEQIITAKQDLNPICSRQN